MTQTTKTFAATGHQTGHAQLPQLHLPRNEGMALDLDWVARATANRSAIERRAATIGTRRSVKKAYQTAWLARAVTMIDLTTLSGDDTRARRYSRASGTAADHSGGGLRLSRHGRARA